MNEIATLSFDTPRAWAAWLAKHHASTTGLWLCIHKKDSGKPTVTYAQALDVALCYGWIDGLKRSLDEDSWLQKFTPRGPRSGWSKVNVGHVARLAKAGKMRAAGLKQVALAKADGRWEKAYDSSKTMVVPQDLLKALAKDKKALAFFKSLNRANLFAITYRLQTAKKPETRQRRMDLILSMLAKGEAFHVFKERLK